MDRQTGTVKWYDKGKGYGFIERPTGEDVFVHATGLDGAQSLEENDRVEFEVGEGKGGKPKAINVKIIV